MPPGCTSLSLPFWKDLVLVAAGQSSRLPGLKAPLQVWGGGGGGGEQDNSCPSQPEGEHLLPAGHGLGGWRDKGAPSCIFRSSQSRVGGRKRSGFWKILSKTSSVLFGAWCEMNM